MKASDDMISTKKEFTEFSEKLEGIAGRVSTLEAEARVLEKEISSIESRRDNINEKFGDEDAAIKESLEESKKYDRLLEALQHKLKQEENQTEACKEEESGSENDKPNTTTTAA